MGPSTPSNDFEQWYRSEYLRVHAAVRAALRVSGGEVDEVVDEAFTRAFERWAKLSVSHPDTGAKAAWTARVAINIHRRSWWRSTRLSHLVGHDSGGVAIAGFDPTALDTWDALPLLTRRQREALVLRHMAGYSQRDIADIHGVAQGTTAATLNQARSRMRSLLSEETNVSDLPEKEGKHVA